MEHVILVIDGMTCINCQNRIEQKLNNTDGISYAKVFYSQNKAEIDYDPELITLHQIGSMINELGYGVQRNKAERAFEKFKTPVIILLIIILFALLQISGLLNILVPSRLADSQMGYGMLFIVGLLTSVHCVAMCGGINFSQSINSITASKSFAGPLFYNIGRVISYTMIGFLLGLLGMFITGGAGGGIPTVLQGILKITAGVVMIIMGINLLGILPGFRRRMIGLPNCITKRINSLRQGNGEPFIVGLLNGFMPCGPMQSMQIIALGSGNPITGALSMFMFSLGTIPLMMGLGTFVTAIGKRYARAVIKIAAMLVVVLGLAMFTQGGNLIGINNIIPDRVSKEYRSESNVAEISEKGDRQIVESDLELGAYPEITVYRGVPVRWTINVSDDVINGCNYKMILKEYDIIHEFSPGENVIEFTPDQTGSFQYTCWMGMIYGKINVIDKDM